MRSLRTGLRHGAWPLVPLLLLGGCVEGQKPTPLKRAAPPVTTHAQPQEGPRASTEKAKPAEADKAKAKSGEAGKPK